MADELWRAAAFDALSNAGLYEILALRQRVFAVEQRILYVDADGRDAEALHLTAHDRNGTLVAYARIFLPSGEEARCAVGRVVVAPEARGAGLGRALMREALHVCAEHAPGAAAKVAAQAHLQRFYEELGFTAVSGVYDEVGIPHMDMVRRSPDK